MVTKGGSTGSSCASDASSRAVGGSAVSWPPASWATSCSSYLSASASLSAPPQPTNDALSDATKIHRNTFLFHLIIDSPWVVIVFEYSAQDLRGAAHIRV